MRTCVLHAVLGWTLAAPVFGGTLDVAWWRDGRVESLQLSDGAQDRRQVDGGRQVALGSLWKLFVYIYGDATGVPTPEYRCGGQDPEEVYCCGPGQSIGRDAALAQSCAPFFAPARLLLRRAPWREYWAGLLGTATRGDFAWLDDPSRLEPGRMVRIDALLRALAAIPPAQRANAESALLRVVLDGRGAGTARWFGSQLRVKTYSWQGMGGGAGWLADGTPVWFGGAGTSSGVLRRWAPRLAASLPPVRQVDDAGCVEVEFFQRYPIRSVQGPGGAALAGPLHGRFVVRFANGQVLAIRSAGELTLEKPAAGAPRIRGRFGVNEYVARVIDREASAHEREAAKALAVAARTYLQQNARLANGCQLIADSSRTQRVSPNPPTAAALAVARWTDRLIVDGATVRYHRDQAGPDTLSWLDALRAAKQGRYFDELLAQAYPAGALATSDNSGQSCVRLRQNEAWLARAASRWRRVLIREPGFEAPSQPPLVCELPFGAPYSEENRNRIFMRPLATREDRITLAHEYLHLCLKRHPRGHDEAYVERLARRLVDQPQADL